MTEIEKDTLLANCLEDYHRRRGLGEAASAEDYRERLGAHFEEFTELIMAETQLDAALELEVQPDLPRPFGEYTLLRELGRGAMGVVYQAVHRPLGRQVALKVLRTGFDTDATARERFRREARACAHVRHDHIVAIHDVGEVDRMPYYTMDILEGAPLHEAEEAGLVTSREDLCRGMADVADALQQLHDAEIVHRDVKPSNIFVERSGRMVLADFGLARSAATERLTTTGQALGTPLYMSPEQMRGQWAEVDGRSDVYGLGASLYEMLCGSPIFRASDPMALLRMVMNERPEPLDKVRSDLPKELVYVVMKSIEKNPADRYQSAAEFRDDLRAFAEGRPVTGRPVTKWAHRVRAARKYWPLPVAAAAVVFGGVLWAQNRPGTLRVQSFPEADVYLEGAKVGRTSLAQPYESDLSPGRYRLELRLDGFVPMDQMLEITPGDTQQLSQVMVAQNGEDPEALAKLQEALGVAWAAAEAKLHRGGLDEGALPIFPRGDVRVADLSSYRLDVGPMFLSEGTLEFRVGETVLHSAAFEPEEMVTTAGLPEAVLAGVEPGTEVTWGFHPSEGEPVTTTFRVVEEPDLGLSAHAELLAQQPANVRRLIESRALLSKGLALASYVQARAVADGSPDSLPAWRTAQAALQQLDLTESEPFLEVGTHIDRLQRDKAPAAGEDE